MYLLGYDIGSSSIKASLLNAETGDVAASAASPQTELEIIATQPGWAEQDPQVWWDHVKLATSQLLSGSGVHRGDINAVGICYQMHGLVVVDGNLQVLRPSIIWCDSRAVDTGNRAFHEIGEKTCLARYLNSPGNFTASKLKWVQTNEPGIYKKIHKIMLPGEYIAMRMTGEVNTTPSGLSEGILWDYPNQGPADSLLSYYGIASDLIPDVFPVFSVQGRLTRQAADETGLKPGTPVTYRSGDQPNNAWSLNVLNPGELAATAGTSGVVYGVARDPVYDSGSRVNTFVHVNHSRDNPRYGVLMCMNGTGILYSWLKQNLAVTGRRGMDYGEMNSLAGQAPAGSQGLFILPYGNGAERTLENREPGASVHGLNFNIHGKSHVLRAAQEGIAFALNYGIAIMKEMGLKVETVRAGNANLFLSPLFCGIFAAVTGTAIQLYNTDNAQGAARGAGVGAGIYKNVEDAFANLKKVGSLEPEKKLMSAYQDLYGTWKEILNRELSTR